MQSINQKSLRLHSKHRGKLEIKSKVPLKNLQDLCLAYTPGVAGVSNKIAADGRQGKVYTIKNNTVAVVTDGSAVLGLGNIGPLAALPVMEGKAILLKRFAGIDGFPICLNTQDTEKIIETVKFLAPTFGAIQLEDISAPRCFEIEKRLQKALDIPVLHDDQHSTAVVVLAGLINALKITGRDKHRAKVIINGAGAAGMGIASLLIAYGFKKLIILDSRGIMYANRPHLGLEKRWLAKNSNRAKIKGGLKEALQGADAFIGVSKKGLLKSRMIKTMNPRPIIFALANPEPEILPSKAYKAGAKIVATGRGDFPNQINNVLAFPGIFRGALDNNVRLITQGMLIQAAKNLSALVKRPTAKKILPSLFDLAVAKTVARAIK